MTPTIEIRQDGHEFQFIDAVETLWRRQEGNPADLLSEEEIGALRDRFSKSSNTLEKIDNVLAGISDLMCRNDDEGICKRAAIRLSSLLELLGDQVATCNKAMSDAHGLMETHYDRAATIANKKAASRANAKAA